MNFQSCMANSHLNSVTSRKLCNLQISLSLAVTEAVSYSNLCNFIVVPILFLVIYYLVASDSLCYFCSQCPAISQALWKRCSGHTQVVHFETADKQSQSWNPILSLHSPVLATLVTYSCIYCFHSMEMKLSALSDSSKCRKSSMKSYSHEHS